MADCFKYEYFFILNIPLKSIKVLLKLLESLFCYYLNDFRSNTQHVNKKMLKFKFGKYDFEM